ncbi:hypothetical protein DSO57_1037607, partial [Entomophthora muscae]
SNPLFGQPASYGGSDSMLLQPFQRSRSVWINPSLWPAWALCKSAPRQALQIPLINHIKIAACSSRSLASDNKHGSLRVHLIPGTIRARSQAGSSWLEFTPSSERNVLPHAAGIQPCYPLNSLIMLRVEGTLVVFGYQGVASYGTSLVAVMP